MIFSFYLLPLPSPILSSRFHAVASTLSLPRCGFHVVASTLSLPRCCFHVVASTLSLPRCRFQVVTSTLSKLSLPRRRFHVVEEHGSHVDEVRVLARAFFSLFLLSCYVYTSFSWWYKWLTGQTWLLLVKIGNFWRSKLCSNLYVFQRPPFSVWKQALQHLTW